MNLGRLRLGEWVAAAGGAVLLVSLFLPWWYRGGGVDPEHDVDGRTGFESFGVLDIVLVAIALLAIALAALQATQTNPAIPVGAAVLTVIFGALSALLVLYRIVNQPGRNELIEVLWTAWVGFAAAVAITAGGWESMRNERVRGLPPDLEPELRPPPPDS